MNEWLSWRESPAAAGVAEPAERGAGGGEARMEGEGRLGAVDAWLSAAATCFPVDESAAAHDEGGAGRRAAGVVWMSAIGTSE